MAWSVFAVRISIAQVPDFAEQSRAQAAVNKPSKQQAEKETAEALGEAFGKKVGAQKAREMILDVMKKNGHEHLIPRFIKLNEASE